MGTVKEQAKSWSQSKVKPQYLEHAGLSLHLISHQPLSKKSPLGAKEKAWRLEVHDENPGFAALT